MELDFDAMIQELPILREKQEEAMLPRDFHLPHIDDEED